MRLINKLERKYGRFGISNLTLYIILCYVVGYVLQFVRPELLSYLRLEPGLILQGQVWKTDFLVLIPPGVLDYLLLLCYCFLLFSGYDPGRTWGTFRYTLFIFFPDCSSR